MARSVRVRFAPSPTGFMHLGNVRAALLNYLFARQQRGTFVLRIEDTDAQRNLDVAGKKILDDLAWLGLTYDEGPIVGGEFGPYNQSERSAHHQKRLDELIAANLVYRCFCTPEDLERKRERQIALKKPPRYDRTCLHMSLEKVKEKIAFGLPFIWRFIINQDQLIEIKDLAKGTVKFEMHNFADFPLTRGDGSFTFVFANFVDDWDMKMTHVIRGEDHLSNTAVQAALYDAFAVPLPVFWHLPMICNYEGKKLSKRDFGFSLDDLMLGGFVPEAIVNYLATIGTSSTDEVKSLSEIVQNYNFKNISSAASVHYDIEKLTWFNHQWIMRMPVQELVRRCKPFLSAAFPQAADVTEAHWEQLIGLVKSEMRRVTDVVPLLTFCFETPSFSHEVLEQEVGAAGVAGVMELIHEHATLIDSPDKFIEVVKAALPVKKISPKDLWRTLRYRLTGSFSGMGFLDCCKALTNDQIRQRLGI